MTLVRKNDLAIVGAVEEIVGADNQMDGEKNTPWKCL